MSAIDNVECMRRGEQTRSRLALVIWAGPIGRRTRASSSVGSFGSPAALYRNSASPTVSHA